jgi:hypothetical protein
VSDQSWQIGGALDLAAERTGAGKLDLLWRNNSNGQVIVWEMDGTTPVQFFEVPPVADTNWLIFNR